MSTKYKTWSPKMYAKYLQYSIFKIIKGVIDLQNLTETGFGYLGFMHSIC